MQWNLEWGPYLKKLQRAQASGVKVRSLENRPSIPTYLLDFWEAYRWLDKTRDAGFTRPSYIKISEVVAYASLNGFSGQDRVILQRLILILDEVFMEWWTEKNGHGGPKSRR